MNLTPNNRTLNLLARYTLLSVLLTSNGCTPEPEPEPVDTGPREVISQNLSGNSRYVWEQEPRPYVIRDLVISETKNDQKRIASLVMEYPETKEEVRVATREVFNGFWEDITNFGASNFQRIEIRVFCCEEDAIENNGFHIFEVEGGGLNDPVLPKFDQANQTWQWREAATPDEQTRTIFRAYWDEQQRIPGDNPSAEADIVKRLAATHSMTVKEIAAKIVEGWLWRSQVSTNAKRIEYEVKQSLERWKLNE
ncbi:MAG: hypothetical protein AB8G99_12310 [Planctomycetaceae bacterium]